MGQLFGEAHHYRAFLIECGWIDERCVITDAGRRALDMEGQ